MDLIEPTHFDAIVVTSGLPELLIGSALARAGKSVLILDSTDSYGASWGSLNGPDYVHTMVNRHLAHQLLRQHQNEAQQQPAVQQSDHQHDASSGAAAGCIPLQPALQLHDVSGCSLYTHPQVEEALAQKGLLIDLAPKVMYQDESMVQLLVACQAHNYLEFKLVEGSYIYMTGKLRPVPASRADLFADKMLPLAAKRTMGRFLAACMEAEMGYGRLKDAFGPAPLVDLLLSEGLDEQLQQVVLYGIAMADTPQEQQQQQQQTAAVGLPAEAAGPPVHNCSNTTTSSSSAHFITAAEGFAALQLYTRSLGRYGGGGAFMAPCYGCGSLPEAFVRLAAVKGAIIALRHAVQQIQLQPDKGVQSCQQQQQKDAADSISSNVRPLKAAEAARPPAANQAATSVAVEREGNDTEATAAAAKARVVLSSGQQLTTELVVCCTAAAAHAAHSSNNNSNVGRSCTTSAAVASATAAGEAASFPVACAVAMLDGSVVDGTSSLLLVFPPGSLGNEQSGVVIRGVQLGPAFGVTPPGKYLLYLSAVLQPSGGSSGGGGDCSSSSSAEQVLRPALEALVLMAGLQALDMTLPPAANQDAGQQQQQHQPPPQDVLAATMGRDSSSVCQDCECTQQQQQQAAPVTLLPQALAVCYYMTEQQHLPHRKQQQHADESPSSSVISGSSGEQDRPVLWCPSAAHGLIGYDSVLETVESLYRQHCPGLPWLTDPLPIAAKSQAAAAVPGADSSGVAAGGVESVNNQQRGGENSSDAGGGVFDGGELDAIDELTAALMELGAPEQQQQ